jgi:hypothetical protein
MRVVSFAFQVPLYPTKTKEFLFSFVGNRLFFVEWRNKSDDFSISIEINYRLSNGFRVYCIIKNKTSAPHASLHRARERSSTKQQETR